jgi:hypothetical protein
MEKRKRTFFWGYRKIFLREAETSERCLVLETLLGDIFMIGICVGNFRRDFGIFIIFFVIRRKL